MSETAVMTVSPHEARRQAERLRRLQSALLTLTHHRTWREYDLAALFRHVTGVASHALGVDRVSIWRYTPARDAVRCADLYERPAERHSAGAELRAADYPAYFRALESAGIVAAADAVTDPQTSEFAESYLRPADIGAMMDVPTYLHERPDGVLCCEHVGGCRVWHPDEQTFAVAVANLVSLALEREERHGAEQQRAALERKLQETARLESLGVLAGGIAHDFNNLLTAVLGYASLIEGDLPADSPLRPLVQPIEQAAQRAAELCGQMLAYAGKGRFVVRPVDLTALVRDAASLLRLTVPKRARLAFRLEAALPPVTGDAAQLRQAVTNLVMNAAEALGDAEGTITLTTAHAAVRRAELDAAAVGSELPEGAYVVLEVSDTGCGMSDEVRRRAFEPFFTTKFIGRGLGLPAVMGIVRGHQGALCVGSAPGRGTTFRLLLPAAVV
jgi:signal transduction histidine kinase